MLVQDKIVAAFKRFVYGSTDTGVTPTATSVAVGPPAAVEMKGSTCTRADAPTPGLLFYVSMGGGNWFPLATAASTNISVANEAAATAYNFTGLPDGTPLFIRSHQSIWIVRTQAAALVAHEIIANTPEPARQLVRQLNITSPNYAIEPAWWLDPAGSDEALGTTNLTPLQTLDELARRVPVVGEVAAITVTLNPGNYPNAQWNPIYRGLATPPAITIVGTRTLGGNLIVASSSNETPTAPPLIDAGAALTIGKLVQATSGAQNGATAAVVALVAGTQFQLSPWRSALGVRVAPPAPADTIAIVTNPSTPQISVGSAALQMTLQNLSTPILTTTGYKVQLALTCDLPMAANAFAMTSGGQVVMSGCAVSQTGPVFNVQFGRLQITLTGFSRTQGNIGALTAVGSLFLGDCVMSGGDGVAARQGALLGISSLGVFGTSTTALESTTGALVNIFGTLYGDASNAGKGTKAHGGGRIFVAANIVPTLGATGQELELENAATANPTALGVPAAAVALTSWNGANPWTGALTFNRSAVSYTSGACVSSY